jgi:hypothetical protein
VRISIKIMVTIIPRGSKLARGACIDGTLVD